MKFRHGVLIGAVVMAGAVIVSAVTAFGAICTLAFAEDPDGDEVVTPTTPAQEA